MNLVLSRKGLDTFSVDQYRYFVGKGSKQLVRCVLPKENIDKKLQKKYFQQ